MDRTSAFRGFRPSSLLEICAGVRNVPISIACHIHSFVFCPNVFFPLRATICLIRSSLAFPELCSFQLFRDRELIDGDTPRTPVSFLRVPSISSEILYAEVSIVFITISLEGSDNCGCRKTVRWERNCWTIAGKQIEQSSQDLESDFSLTQLGKIQNCYPLHELSVSCSHFPMW